jgi:diacylglycerol kinase (ATP)
MSLAGLIVNPKSGRGNKKGLALAERLRRSPEVSIHVLDDFRELGNVLVRFAQEGVSELYVSSGDGTVQGIQTLIAERGLFGVVPRLCLLPHGTTNMTAADLGFRRRSLEAQAYAIESHTLDDLQSRPTLRLLNPRDGHVRHGMFLGAGAVTDATVYCQHALNDRGIKGSWATFSVLASAALRTMFAKPDPNDPNRFDRPYPITVHRGSGTVCTGQQLLVLCTTLNKLILHANPFWGVKTGPIRVSVFPYPVPSVARWLLPILYGGEGKKGPPGARSFSTDRFEIETPSVFVLDGEFFEAPVDGPLKIESGPIFTYIRG